MPADAASAELLLSLLCGGGEGSEIEAAARAASDTLSDRNARRHAKEARERKASEVGGVKESRCKTRVRPVSCNQGDWLVSEERVSLRGGSLRASITWYESQSEAWMPSEAAARAEGNATIVRSKMQVGRGWGPVRESVPIEYNARASY